MKTKPNFQKIRHWLHIAIYILVLLLFANYESQRKQHPERNKLFVDQHQQAYVEVPSNNSKTGKRENSTKKCYLFR